MAIGADRTKIFYRIQFVALSNIRQRGNMVDVNIVLSGFTIRFLKIHIAYAALAAVMIYAFVSCCFTTFVFVNFDLLYGTFVKGFRNIIWIIDIHSGGKRFCFFDAIWRELPDTKA